MARAVDPVAPQAVRLPDGSIQFGDVIFADWTAYRQSDAFYLGQRCGTKKDVSDDGPRAQADCSLGNTNPSASYDPSVVKYRIPVVVHVIQHSSGAGFISESDVRGQIATLNEDFLAIPGSNGGDGSQSTDVQVEFFLVDEDPNGQPTNGIDYVTNDGAFNDSGSYWNSIAWDPNRYMNIYTNDIADPDTLGYVPGFPAEGIAGNLSDRVVIRYQAFGPSGIFPNDLGRTLTHEVGHYLGLYHTFHDGFGCPSGSAPGCYSLGDRICDTPPEDFEHFICIQLNSCGNPDDISNYMNYTDDVCMDHFTPEQARRMRCTLESYRSQLYQIANPNAGACCQINQICSVRSPQDCAAGGGLFKGAGVSCTTGICSPEVEPGDTCETAPTLTTSFVDLATTIGKVNNYTGATCGQLFGTASSLGSDVVYRMVSPGGGNISVTVLPASTFDVSAYVITNCANPGTSCVNGDDQGGTGEVEQFNFAATAGTIYFLIVDGFNGGTGNYAISVSITGGVNGACCMPTGFCTMGAQGDCEGFGGTFQGNGSTCDGVDCPMPPGTGGCCDPNGDCFIDTEGDCESIGGTYQGDFSLCTPNPCIDPLGACCAPNDTCSVTVRSACLGGGGTFIGSNTTCIAPNCSDIPGACCLPDGSCESLVFSECQTNDGLFKGFSLACVNANCPTPTGACCTDDAPCQLLTHAACDAEGGTYQGNATSCTSNPCPALAATGGCCDSNFVCTVRTQSACENLSHSYRGDNTECTNGQCPTPTGACCFSGGACTVIAQASCEAATGVFGGEGTNCANGCNDQCLDDPDKTAPGECGCGVTDDDSDGDGEVDCRDACKDDANKTQPGNCGCGRPEVAGCPPDAPIGQETPCCAAGGAEATFAPFLLLGLGVIRRRYRQPTKG